ncbi:hypothetical protein JMJ78_0013502 [Colletotrichum scovillei]|nr:hypothetical protein JMJ78_0013502 [Colletotrichum scovillei]
MRRKKLTEGPLDHELACELNYLHHNTPELSQDNFSQLLLLFTIFILCNLDIITPNFNMQFSSLTFAVLLCTASGALAQNQPRDKYKCYVPFDTCDKPIPAELKASMAKEFGTRSECRTTEVVYYGAPDAAIEGVYCEPGPVRAMGGMFSYSVGRVSTACHAKCEIWG